MTIPYPLLVVLVEVLVTTLYLYMTLLYTSRPSHYITVTQFQYILTISITWEFAKN